MKQASIVAPVAAAATKSVPLVGSILSGLSAAQRLAAGDYLGAGIDAGAIALTPFPAASIGLNMLNMVRDIFPKGNDKSEDILTEREQKIFKRNNMKYASSNFQQDLQNLPDSELYKTVEPLISPELPENAKAQDLDRVNKLKDQVRKGLISLEYMTGLKKNLGETFYDAHPVEATATDVLSKAPGLGLAAGGLGLGKNLYNQWANMRLTEPAKMSRTENPLDSSNPSELLNPSDSRKAIRSDISGLFGDLESSPEHRLKLIDRLSNKAGPDSFHGKYTELLNHETLLNETHQKNIAELRNKILQGSGKSSDARQLESLIKHHTENYEQELKKLNQAKKSILQAAKGSEGNTALQKYVNLHESLRRSGGKLKGYMGEGLGPLSGIADLAEKYHITGANPAFDKELLHNIAMSHGGSQATEAQLNKFLGKTLNELSDPSFQRSGLKKFLSRHSMPLKAGLGIAAGGTGLYHLLKMMQEANYSPTQIKEWKKNLLKSRGDYQSVKALEEAEKQKQLGY